MTRYARLFRLALPLALGTLLSASALAKPLVVMDGGTAKPGVVTAWSGSGKKITLELEADADPAAVAAAIEAKVDRVRTKVRGGKLLVIGKTQDDLLAALAEIELGGEDDLSLLAAAATEDAVDSGSSLRAKKTAELKKLLKDRATVAQGQVVSVKQGKFPTVQVTVRILRGPTGKLGSAIRKGKSVVFSPVYGMKAGALDLGATNTQTNLGAYYLSAGDRVKVKVGKAVEGGYEAELITR